ncbi:hypothetical protein Suden_0803 [Sulfurimonas denitrificans DSM 1251]|uniref:Uncharacterized protein n=1 Tax=Sulfurimonas denitrificans (strain ATCC 33889 / DSM 1251) TaxID=326298 RepID=Q30SE9_SULDN|nr:hypothetical protein [Sulfurimonas denitrificans]ABB44082.1 hypothetical protein Suden_0803 [Sulfurimonas denitrificans DSM 1251]
MSLNTVNYSISFEQNKIVLNLIKDKFIQEASLLLSIVESFSKNESPSRTSLCEAFRLFGNAKYTWFSGGEEDIKALCQGVLTGYQDANSRKFKNSILSKVKIFIEKNDKESFFNLSQSIYRSAQQNAPIIYNTDNEFQFENREDFYELEEENEILKNPTLGDLHNFYMEVLPWQEESKIKAGNIYKKKTKKTLKKIQSSLFEGDGI